MLTDIFLSDKAFIGMVLSAVEVYKKEYMGALLGYNLRKRIVVEYAIPYQTAKRKPTEVEPNWSREKYRKFYPKCYIFSMRGIFTHTLKEVIKKLPLS